MLSKTKILLVVVLVIVAVTLSLYADAAEKITRLLIGTTSTTSSFYSYFVGASKSINRLAPGINSSVVATGASVDNIERLRKGQIDLGLSGQM